MPSRPPSRSDRSRAEARRRARLAAQGEPAEDADVDESTPQAPPTSGGGGFLARIFPPAAPLRGHEHPLEGFDYIGSPRFRGISETIWILARNPLAWIGAGAVWAVSRLLTDNSAVGIAMSVVSFGSLIAAGWFGWRRPWLYGAAAALLGWIAVLLVLVTLLLTNPDQVSSLLGTESTATASPTAAATPVASAAPSLAPSPAASPAPNVPQRVTTAGIAFNILLQTIFQLAIGTAAGWYGGYLRRRTAQGPPASQNRRRR
ncbi:MAG: hypothetical protein ABI534_00620 [Chloroflexota bacterium]